MEDRVSSSLPVIVVRNIVVFTQGSGYIIREERKGCWFLKEWNERDRDRERVR